MPNTELAYLKPYASLRLNEIPLSEHLLRLFAENNRLKHRVKFFTVGDIINRVEQMPSLGHVFQCFADWSPQDIRELRRALRTIPHFHTAR